MSVWISHPSERIEGTFSVPGDKSISHRAIILGAIAEGITEINGFLSGEDCLATLRAFQAMGVNIVHRGARVTIYGRGLRGLNAPGQALDMGNSGTSMRLLAGLLAGQRFASSLTGDASLGRRPMRRVTEPLQQMGADIRTGGKGGTAPLFIGPGKLHGIDYTLEVRSAQVKSALLLAGLLAKGETTVRRIEGTRDHTERMLRKFGAELVGEKDAVTIRGGQMLMATPVEVPGDISSATFFIVAALIAKTGMVKIENVGVNPTRSAVIDILRAMGGDISLERVRERNGEPIADIVVRASKLHGITVDPRLVPIAIDEFPAIFIAAACAEGITHATELGELRVKESDRLGVMAQGLRANGVFCEEGNDTLTIEGGHLVGGGKIDSQGDHRIAMSFAVAGLAAHKEIEISGCETVATSFPNFLDLARRVGMRLNEIPYA